MTLSEIPSRPPGKLYTKFQLKFWEIQLEEMEKDEDQKNVMMKTQQIVMDASIKDDAAIVTTASISFRSPGAINFNINLVFYFLL